MDTWLQVMPQIIARIHTRSPAVKRQIRELLLRIGAAHPQAYPNLIPWSTPLSSPGLPQSHALAYPNLMPWPTPILSPGLPQSHALAVALTLISNPMSDLSSNPCPNNTISNPGSNPSYSGP